MSPKTSAQAEQALVREKKDAPNLEAGQSMGNAMKSKFATLVASPALILTALLITPPAHANGFGITDLVTDDNTNLASLGLPAAAHVDANLVNPWGISFSPTSPFWISDNGMGVSTLYNAAGVPNALVVTVAPGLPGGFVSAPTGTVFNNNSADFMVPTGAQTTGSANFLFDTENGVISGRASAVSTNQTFIGVDNSASGAVYKGLAIAPGAGGHNVIFASNFNSGMVEEYNSTWGLVKTFTDPSLPPVPAGTPAGQNWAPFNVQVLNGQLYVTYALQDAAHHDDVAGSGYGFVDVFTTDGTFVKRVVDVGAGDPLDSPWGLAIAPAGFGTFANDLLVGNFGDGEIDAFNLTTDSFVGVVTDPNGNPIEIPGLWALVVRNGVNGFNPNAVYFTAGLPLASNLEDLEQAGVFGLLVAVPEPSTIALLLAGLAGMFWYRRKRVAPVQYR
jgi:uncharacterized protein (TIGR03118 family)